MHTDTWYAASESQLDFQTGQSNTYTHMHKKGPFFFSSTYFPSSFLSEGVNSRSCYPPS